MAASAGFAADKRRNVGRSGPAQSKLINDSRQQWPDDDTKANKQSEGGSGREYRPSGAEPWCRSRLRAFGR